ncbi:MAG: RluA family pseudouridine synthase [Myxococcota bacterium]
MVTTLQVPPEAKGTRLDHYLRAALLGLSRARIQRLIDEQRVEVDGQPAKASRKLKGGEEVRVTVPAPKAPSAVAQPLPLRILFQDADLVVVDKAAGMVVHPAAGNWEGTLVNALLFQIKDLAGVGDQLRPGLVHRLDKDTSGCLVVAKNDQALAGLQAAFKSRKVVKTYLALVHGQPREAGTFRTLYGRHPVHRKRFTGKVKEGKPAVTHFEVRERFDGAALLEVRLETGRTHQIRVHLAEAGHPLLGDALYGGAKRGPKNVREAMAALGRQALHAWRLAFDHPRTGERLFFEAEPPEDFQRALKVLRTRG